MRATGEGLRILGRRRDLSREIIKSETILRDLYQGGGSTYVLKGKVVSGRLDLRHRKVDVAVEIRECEFLDDVDFRYCEFLQTVDLSRCIFRGEFNSGDATESHTIYHKDLTCSGAVFKKSASFNGCKIEGSAFFSGVTFDSAQDAVDFTTASIGNTLELDGAVFKCPATFGSLNCGSIGVFTDARFESTEDVRFDSATFGGSFACDGAKFHGRTFFDLLRCGGRGGFRSAEFKSQEGVNFVGASFGSNIEATVATFEGPATFNSLKCGLDGFFDGTHFKSDVEFGYAVFEGNLNCSDVSFEGPASFVSTECRNLGLDNATFDARTVFNHLKCANVGSFRRTIFRGLEQVSFGYASFENTLVCSDTVFQGPAEFGALRCSGSIFFNNANFVSEGDVSFASVSAHGLEFQQAKFAGSASFNGCNIVRGAFFNNAEFNGLDFGHASIQKDLYFDGAQVKGRAELGWIECRNLICRGTIFGGDAQFNSLRCGVGASFVDARFGNDATFDYATFGKALDCNTSKFYGNVSLRSVTCGGSAFFNGIEFLGERWRADWSDTVLDGNLECQDTTFCGDVRFDRLSCKGSGIFNRTRFLSLRGVSYTRAKFDGDLRLEGTIVVGSANLSMVQVSQDLVLNALQLGREISLHGATVGTLRLEGEGFPSKGVSSDLRDLSFARFSGSKEKALSFTRSQHPTKFTRQPYLQLERAYSRAGNEVEAKQTHYRGRRDLRENAKTSGGATKWSWWTKLGDLLWKWLSGYGARTYLLALYILIFLIVGTAVFWANSAVTPRSSPPPNTAVAVAPADESPESPPRWRKPLAPIGYSLDLFIPVLNLRFEDRWEPAGQWRGGYALVHTMAGWILVPLLVGALAGLVRRR